MHAFCGPILPTILPTNPALWERKTEIVVRERELFSHANQSCANKQAGMHFFQTRDCIANIYGTSVQKGPLQKTMKSVNKSQKLSRFQGRRNSHKHLFAYMINIQFNQICFQKLTLDLIPLENLQFSLRKDISSCISFL